MQLQCWVQLQSILCYKIVVADFVPGVLALLLLLFWCMLLWSIVVSCSCFPFVSFQSFLFCFPHCLLSVFPVLPAFLVIIIVHNYNKFVVFCLIVSVLPAFLPINIINYYQ